MRLSTKTLAAAAAAVAVSCASAPAFAQGPRITNQYLTGVWQEDQQCNGHQAMVFYANNTMSSAGSPAASYAVTGPAQIVMYGPGGSMQMGVRYVNQNQMVITYNNDATVLFRCSGGSAPAPTQLSSAYFIGGWGFNGNCSNPDVFSNNGRVRTSQGPATWALFGNTLRLTNNNGVTTDFAVQVNGHRNMTLTQTTGGYNVSNYTRCF